MRVIRLNDGEHLFIDKGHLVHSTLDPVDRHHAILCQYNDGVEPVNQEQLWHIPPSSLVMSNPFGTDHEAVNAVKAVCSDIEARMKAFGAVEVLALTYYPLFAYQIEGGTWTGELQAFIVGTAPSSVYRGLAYLKGAP